MSSLNLLFSSHPEILRLKKMARERHQRLVLVGGFLRDHVLGRDSHDLDFAVSQDAIALARRFAKAVKGAFILLDAESGCARVARKYPDGLWTYDFADFRSRTLKGDLAGRDFTVNTLTLDISGLDPKKTLAEQVTGDRRARADIKSRTVRMVGAKAFKEDPLRLLRAYSLYAQLGFKVESKTLTAVKAQKALIRSVSPERVREELFKVLSSARAARVIKCMDRDGMLFEVMPQIRVMYGVTQGGYHHLNVWQHSLEALVQLEKLLKRFAADAALMAYLNEEVGGGHSRLAILRLACILHDIGKPDAKKKEPGGRTSFHTHEHIGRRIVRIMALQLMLSTKERYALEDMVTFHLRPGYLSNFKRPSEKAVYRYFRDTKDNAVAIFLLSMADQQATRGALTTDYDVKHHEDICLPLIRRYFSKKKEMPLVRLLTGHDLIKELELEPGPLFARILLKIEEAQQLGKITTREEALALARKAAK
ncbi:MAG: HD domain-containing protein [Candidatus Omnitrophica bacterium]|nr:HD domain-containing protein [Candidatus Omnitrophota bacterium]